RRHNDGYYQLSDWGPFDSQWVTERKKDIAASLGFCA
ncbi:helix-turn-helix domain-containing protein, partial [Vibrio cholerae]